MPMRVEHDLPVTMDSKVCTGFVCHDAGGAEHVARLVRDRFPDHVLCVEGPALSVFQRVLGAARIKTFPLAETIDRAKQVVTGTGWQTRNEVMAIRAARTADLRVASVLDHWVNYRDRFTFERSLVLPDELWVTDEIGLLLAQQEIPEVPVRLIPNEYLRDFQSRVAHIRAGREKRSYDGLQLLFLGDNVSQFALATRGDAQAFGFTQADALRHVMARLDRIDSGIQRLTVRPHPSELGNEYEDVLRGSEIPYTISRGDLAVDIAECDIAVGFGTMALFLANSCGVRSMTCYPPGARDYCGLPSGLGLLPIE